MRIKTLLCMLSLAALGTAAIPRTGRAQDAAGNGLGFVSRIDDQFFLVNALEGLIEAMPRFLVVSAFYRTEDLEHNECKVHAAHALSIIRGVAAPASNGSGG